MHKHQSVSAVATLLFLAAAPAVAAKLDTPTLHVVRVSQSSIVLEIVAGASGAPRGFAVEWMTKQTYDAGGGWDPSARTYCGFLDQPTVNTWANHSFRLGAHESAQVEVGDLFDETGLSAQYDIELDPGVEYVFRAYARGQSSNKHSDYTPTSGGTTLDPDSRDCTFTQGYWKNHEEAWPVSSLTLGTVVYTKAQLLLILREPARGNGLVFLSHQLIAAKLNRASGASAPPSVLQAIADADALIGNRVVPPIGDGYLAPDQASGLNEQLDEYNNGSTGPGHCDTVPAQDGTWGALKIRYR
jgi:hypothetical protein